VDLTDLAALAQRWLATGCAEPTFCDGADVTASGRVDWLDVGICGEYWLYVP